MNNENFLNKSMIKITGILKKIVWEAPKLALNPSFGKAVLEVPIEDAIYYMYR